MKNFEERQKGFTDALQKLGEEYSINLYAANVAMENGEVIPVIKIADLEKDNEEFNIEFPDKEDTKEETKK